MKIVCINVVSGFAFGVGLILASEGMKYFFEMHW